MVKPEIFSVLVYTISLAFLLLSLVSRSSCYNRVEHNLYNGTSVNKIEPRFSLPEFLVTTKVKEVLRPVRCGQPIISSNYDSRIVGGRLASIRDFPWMVSLQREKGYWFGFKAYSHSCGGSMLTESWIITAAHCIYGREEPLRAVAGTDNLNFLYRAQLRSISQVIVHPDFDTETYNNDIALLKVNRPFNLGSTFSQVGVICLERNVSIVPYDIATICGFGAKAYHEKVRTHLYKTDIAIIDRSTCNESFSYKITENMICAGGMIASKRDACQGDSGGPLHLEVDDHMSLIGVVSFGINCAIENYPGVYTRLENYFDWISSYLDEPLYEP